MKSYKQAPPEVSGGVLLLLLIFSHGIFSGSFTSSGKSYFRITFYPRCKQMPVWSSRQSVPVRQTAPWTAHPPLYFQFGRPSRSGPESAGGPGCCRRRRGSGRRPPGRRPRTDGGASSRKASQTRPETAEKKGRFSILRSWEKVWYTTFKQERRPGCLPGPWHPSSPPAA